MTRERESDNNTDQPSRTASTSRISLPEPPFQRREEHNKSASRHDSASDEKETIRLKTPPRDEKKLRKKKAPGRGFIFLDRKDQKPFLSVHDLREWWRSLWLAFEEFLPATPHRLDNGIRVDESECVHKAAAHLNLFAPATLHPSPDC